MWQIFFADVLEFIRGKQKAWNWGNIFARNSIGIKFTSILSKF